MGTKKNDDCICCSEDALRFDLQNSLRKQGFIVSEGDKLDITVRDKNDIRNIQLIAKNDILSTQKLFIINKAKQVKNHLIRPGELDPAKINLEIRPVVSGSYNETLFRWWNLVWWSMPYQRPFGRQMRFIIWDTYHNAPFGLIALQSPILKQAVRDKSLGIPNERIDYWVNRSMYAQRVGALPPYNEILGGKMVALSLASNEIKFAYNDKYANRTTIMANRNIESDLLFITTTSAYGRSSIYNRLRYNDDVVAERLGYTEGYGSFQISDDLYYRLLEYLETLGESTMRGYGTGPSRKLKLIRLACRKLGLANYSYHGIKREYYLFSFVQNLHQVISGRECPQAKNYTFADLYDYWNMRWKINRLQRTDQWRNFDMNSYIDEIVLSFEGGVLNE